MKVSIITPTFNSANFISACVENVQSQGDQVLEHIIVDGGSNDGTIEIIADLQKIYKNIIYIAGPDKGQSDALNKGSAASRGGVLSILNCDDFYAPGAVRMGLEALSSLSKPGLVVGDCLIHEHAGRQWWNRPSDLRVESLLLGWRYSQHPVNPSAYFYNREVHHLVGGYDVEEHYAMDVDFILRCALIVPVRYVERHWGNFRLYPGCKTFDDKESADRLAAIYRRYLPKLGARQRANMMQIKIKKDLTAGLRRMRKRLGNVL